MGSNVLPDTDTLTKFVYQGDKREKVPKRDEKPILGLKSNKNFIVSNAVENILSGNLKKTNSLFLLTILLTLIIIINNQAPKVIKENKDWLSKKEFGKTPDYLTKIQNNI